MSSNSVSFLAIVAAAWLAACGAPEKPAPEKPDAIHGSLSKAAIRSVIHDQIGMIHQCLATYGRPGESGRISVRFIIRGGGNVTDVSVPESTLDNPRLVACVAAAPQYWHFPKPDGGGIVIVEYPFEIAVPPEDAGVGQAAEGAKSP